MKTTLFNLIIFLFFISHSFSQDTLVYNISFPNAVHHEAEISLMLSSPGLSEITATMSKSSPGRYAIHNFGMNVYNINAKGRDNSNLTIQRIEPDTWKINDIEDSLIINYTLYANYANGTHSGIDANFANLNMPATLMWIKGMEEHPVKLIFNLFDTINWKIATQLIVIDSAKHIYAASNLQYLMDSPCMLSDFTMKEFSLGDDEKTKIRIAINSVVENDEVDEFVNYTRDIVLEQKEIFGEFPDFMNSTYTFMCSYGPGFYGDGMEHRNSTMISAPIHLSGNLSKLIGTLSHEFFHSWNMERIRPKSLEPFDFTKANVSGELWFGEGFTAYYGDLTLCRAGVLQLERYISNISRSLNYFLNAPGRNFGSPVYMSELASYRDGGPRNDNNNFSNTYISYYNYGEIIALALDLSLRTSFPDVSLDEIMRALWTKHGKDELPYTNSDIRDVVAEVSDDKAFADDFFKRYVYGNEIPDFSNLFDKLGYKLIKKNPNRPSIGFPRFKFEGDTATLLSPPLIGNALYEAGVNQGDLILSIDDQPLTSYPELNFIIGTRKVGDEIEIEFSHHGKLRKGSFKLKDDNQYVLIPKEKFSIRIKEEEQELRRMWLSSKRQQ